MTKLERVPYSKELKALKFIAVPENPPEWKEWKRDLFSLKLFPAVFPVAERWQVTHDKHKGVGSGNSPRDACIAMWDNCNKLREIEKYAVPIPRVPLLVMHEALTSAVKTIAEMGFHADTDVKPLPLLHGVLHAWCRGDVHCLLADDRSGWLTWKEDATAVVGFSTEPKQSLYALQAAHAKEAERSLSHVQGLNFLLRQLDVKSKYTF
jgi:hypothetical protein